MKLTSFSGHSFDASRLPERPRVLDIGCRDFQFALGVLGLRPLAEVHCYDPDPFIEAPYGVQHHPRALVGDGRTKAGYVMSSTGEGNYIREPWWKPGTPPTSDSTIMAECVDIRDITDATRVEKWDLVKLDCEGSEFGILENWPRGGIAGQISVEFHNFKNPERWNAEYFTWLWTQLPDYWVAQHEHTKQGEAWGYWDTLLLRRFD